MRRVSDFFFVGKDEGEGGHNSLRPSPCLGSGLRKPRSMSNTIFEDAGLPLPPSSTVVHLPKPSEADIVLNADCISHEGTNAQNAFEVFSGKVLNTRKSKGGGGWATDKNNVSVSVAASGFC